MDQQSLFDARSTDPASSHQAAPSAERRNVLQQFALTVLAQTGAALTADDVRRLAVDCHPEVERNSWSKRLGDLERLGLVECVGTRTNQRGKAVRTYRLTASAAAA